MIETTHDRLTPFRWLPALLVLTCVTLACQVTNQAFGQPSSGNIPATSTITIPSQAPTDTITPALTPDPENTPTLIETPTPQVAAGCSLQSVLALQTDIAPEWIEKASPNACYELTIDLSSGTSQYSGTERLIFTNQTGQDLDEIVLRLYPNATIIYGGHLQIDQISLDGQPVQGEFFISDQTGFRIPLSQPLPTGQSVTLESNFSGELAQGFSSSEIYGVFVYSADQSTIVMADGYPILAEWRDGDWITNPVLGEGDAVVSPVASYQVTVRYPMNWSIAASGSQISQTTVGDALESLFIANPMREFTLSASANFTRRETQVGDLTIVDWSLPGTASSAKVRLDIADQAVEDFNLYFGNYPYRELDIVNVPLQYASGVEYPGLVLIDYETTGNENQYSGLNLVIAHEIAHQWWYGVVGNDVLTSPWMDEGLATFSEMVYTGIEFPRVYTSELETYQMYVEYQESNMQNTAIGQPLSAFQGDSGSYSMIVYLKGALFFADLRAQLGESTFKAGLQSYYAQNAFEIARPEDLQTAFEGACGCDLDRMFSKWGVYP